MFAHDLESRAFDECCRRWDQLRADEQALPPPLLTAGRLERRPRSTRGVGAGSYFWVPTSRAIRIFGILTELLNSIKSAVFGQERRCVKTDNGCDYGGRKLVPY